MANTGEGLTDACVFISMLFPPDGSYSQALASLEDGRTREPLSGDDLFKAWIMMAGQIQDNPTMGNGKREFVRTVWATHVDAIRMARGLTPKPTPH